MPSAHQVHRRCAQEACGFLSLRPEASATSRGCTLDCVSIISRPVHHTPLNTSLASLFAIHRFPCRPCAGLEYGGQRGAKDRLSVLIHAVPLVFLVAALRCKQLSPHPDKGEPANSTGDFVDDHEPHNCKANQWHASAVWPVEAVTWNGGVA
jgi:hypothetical protein